MLVSKETVVPCRWESKTLKFGTVDHPDLYYPNFSGLASLAPVLHENINQSYFVSMAKPFSFKIKR